MEKKLNFLSKPVSLKNSQDKTKPLYCSDKTHKKISYLANITELNRTQITENIFNKFFEDYKNNIDEIIYSKRNEIRNLFDTE